jgi:DNA-binding transcriptional MocR family regulator
LTRAQAEAGDALLGFANRRNGECWPSHVTIAKRANCATSTVQEAMKALRALGVIDWDMRIVRLTNGRDRQTSNAYVFVAVLRLPRFLSSNLKILESDSTPIAPPKPSALEAALARLGAAIRARDENGAD